jgi:hypothetical protein
MKFFAGVAAFFYLQPSLFISYVPIQISSLIICLVNFKKLPFLNAFFHALAAIISAFFVIFLTGLIIVPFIYVRFFELIEISYQLSVILFIISVFIYWLYIFFYLRYVPKLKNITHIAALSCAIAALCVLTLCYLVWHK